MTPPRFLITARNQAVSLALNAYCNAWLLCHKVAKKLGIEV
jgi:hypothetical protein